ncbi:PLP-dependent aminotransferase family protein [Diaphorobacter ruginosibacter]|uniref:PLP-dependent aminotransferase family protein n=1 Tax=Diaphorobacter ruginosibacter TaxID=1715720 RepID=A0A7G9RS99_9BURK|nr:PLP-dependent aminotransferase family protein [Diaphorobacter ruginosibacter]QNN58474.1 PLP-dependent aminotransferase family protein [Diaphorobacter ruginosibacter]
MADARYKTLVDQLAQEIRAGRLPAGTRLPTHRKLAAQHGLALVTATRVYAELQAMGLVSGETGRGTFVKDLSLPLGLGVDYPAQAPEHADLTFNSPLIAGQTELLRTALRQLANAGDLESLLHYQPHAGRPRDRSTLAEHLVSRGLQVDASQLLFVDGAQHGLTVTAMGLLKPGDVVAVDALTYPGFKLLAQSLRLELQPIPASGDGPDLKALETLCSRRKVRAIYAMPTLHNPLGWVMSLTRRHKLAAIARRHGLLIIEDAAYAFLADAPPPPLAALAPDITIYVSALSKSIATGLRVGFIAAPQRLIPTLERGIRATTWNTAAIMTTLGCGWLEDGTIARLEASKREDAIARQAIVSEVFAGMRTVRHPHSYYVWIPLGEDLRADQVAAALLQEQRIAVSTAEPYATTASVPHALRLALGSISLAQLRAALISIRNAIAY